MGYQESWFYIEPQHKFKKLIQAYEKAEQSGYYEVAGAEPCSIIVLKQPFGDIPAGKKLLWVRRPWLSLCRRGIRRRAEVLRQAPRHSGGGGAGRHRRSPHGGAGL